MDRDAVANITVEASLGKEIISPYDGKNMEIKSPYDHMEITHLLAFTNQNEQVLLML